LETTLDRQPARAEAVAELLKAVAHPLRLRVVAALARAPRRVGDLAESLGVLPSLLSQQLRILRMSDVVVVERSGGGATYRLADATIHRMIACLETCDRGHAVPGGIRRPGLEILDAERA
jgi:ArsR family transcriptional regulator